METPMRFLVLAAVATLASCAGPMIANERQYVADVQLTMRSNSQTYADASTHCAQFGKVAVLAHTDRSILSFDCVSAEEPE